MNAVRDLRVQVLDGLLQEAYRLSSLGRHQDALSCIERAFAVAPRNARIFNTRSMILDVLGRSNEALADVQRALAIDPDYADAINNRGIHYARAGRFEAALACYERSLALDPHQVLARYNRSTALLSLGHWLRGFREFEARWRLFPREAQRLTGLGPVWMGERDVAGKTVLLCHEQGFGDTLQFSRYVVLVMRLGARVVVAAPKSLCAVLGTLPGRPRVVCEGEPVPEHDYCCSLMSLAHVFCTTPENVPAEIPYLRAEKGNVEKWRGRLGSAVRPRIGLVWSGRRYPPVNHVRDMTLDLVSAFLTLNADFVCLQTDLTPGERVRLAKLPNVVRFDDSFTDFADTAGLIENLDLVITVDTAVAHLAGALGKPVWMMNRYASCWRWMQERADSPWYPRMRLFRQRSAGDWQPVVREVRAALGDFVGRYQPPTRPRSRDVAGLLALLNSGLAYHQQGRFAEAIEAYRGVLEVEPGQAEALHYLGVAMAQDGRQAEALPHLSAALDLQPGNAAAHNHLGNALAALERHSEALLSYERAVAINAEFAEAHYNRGMTLVALERVTEAVNSYLRAIALQPGHRGAHNNLGNAYIDLLRHEEALACYERATEVCPDFVNAWVNRANTLRRLGRYEEARDAARVAIERAPAHSEAHGALGAALSSLGRDQEAMAAYRRALELKPDLADAVWNMALAQLAQGDFEQGWRGYEARWKVRALKLSERYLQTLQWLGKEPLQGKTLLLHAEQGYGDSIQFCRYAPVLAALGARVLLGVPSGLGRLMGSLEGVSEVIAQGPVPAFDHHCPLLTLPLALGTQVSTIPRSIPYLREDPVERAAWANRLGARSRPRVGVVWSGSPSHTNDANRSIPLQALLPLMRSDAQWVAVQKEIRSTDAATLSGLDAIYPAGEALLDFADTAALLAELDLLITVDTSVAHLAGALGRPVWILLPFVADWRWMREREDSPWYPTARLFRQSAAGDWANVIERVALALREFVPRAAAQASAYFST